MDQQIEPQFSISSPIKVTLLSSLEDRQIDCRMINTSAAGMRFVADQPLADDEVVAVDFDDHLAVARVRNCLPYGDKYSIGTAQIHSLPKDALPAGKTHGQHIRMLLEEHGWPVDLGREEADEYHGESPATAAAGTEAEPVVEDAGAEAGFDTPRILDGAELAEPEPPMVPPAAAPAPLIPMPVSELRPRVGLAPVAPRQESSKRTVAMVAAGAAIAALAGLYWLPSRHPAPGVNPRVAHSPATAAVSGQPSGSNPGPPVAAPKSAANSTPAPTAAVPPAGGGATHTVKLTVLQPCWITVTADGKPVFAKVLEKGTQDFPFAKFAFVHLGNSHNAEISLDGTTIPPAPGTGALRLVQLTASGTRDIPWSNGDPAAPR